MNPRLTDIPLHADPVRESGLNIDYFQPVDTFGQRWFHFLLGFACGLGMGVLLTISMFGTRL